MSSEIIEQKIRNGALVVDVRTPDEFALGHFPGAVNIPANQIMHRMGEFGEAAHPVVVYCESGQRSQFAALILKASGFSDVTDAGGLSNMPELG